MHMLPQVRKAVANVTERFLHYVCTYPSMHINIVQKLIEIVGSVTPSDAHPIEVDVYLYLGETKLINRTEPNFPFGEATGNWETKLEDVDNAGAGTVVFCDGPESK